ncbi:MBL fold metallo-hydrolase [Seohaeicola zhoushanensis]|uniref:MBL fold metallo-hydrolase n=1 Tax=Seohaeicola zhoushanensis TaxID=1569283 RepID=A0A8J3H3H7_9RHOB|nr:MBL fold metallo-hydrolase [Seohaeicola zhoushanensis]GHF72877.1 MBL fold metallo-hydrolase [Seohaeicola zhoushanensis]
MVEKTGGHEAVVLRFPFPEVPAYGEIMEIRDGILMTRIPLPYRLDHVNIYFIRDTNGWAVVDTGIRTDEAISVWEQLFAGPLKGMTISKVIVTHLHPDHIGLAGWLCERCDAPLLTSYSSFMGSLYISLGGRESLTRHNFDFYRCHGMTDEIAGVVAIQGNEYLRRVAELPPTFQRLLQSDLLEIGTRTFRIYTGDGHAPEQVMLYCEEEKLLFAADQVLEQISPNVSVFPGEPNGDPLGHYLRSLRLMQSHMPEDVLVLPGHRRPFIGLRERCAELEAHHEERCDLIRDTCRTTPQSAAALVPVLFTRKLDAHQMSFAFTETLAHINRLVRRGEVEQLVDAEGLITYRTVTA